MLLFSHWCPENNGKSLETTKYRNAFRDCLIISLECNIDQQVKNVARDFESSMVSVIFFSQSNFKYKCGIVL